MSYKNYAKGNKYVFDFYGDSVSISVDFSIEDIDQVFNPSIQKTTFDNFNKTILDLINYKNKKELNDWVYYQLVRKVSSIVCNKKTNYNSYTQLKWLLMCKSGYDAKLVAFEKSYLFYIYSAENVYDIPYFIDNNKQYICLNYHDFGKVKFANTSLKILNISFPEGVKSFSYKVTHLPDFKTSSFSEKRIEFNYKEKSYHFKIKLNIQVQQLFNNYPVVDFDTYFNIPFNKETYNSLIPFLKENIKNFNTKEGVDYLMNFTRHAFLYEDDLENFGKEKRLSPEQTLFSETSDCDDRAALFFYLIKEIYNIPMIAVLYPTHVTIAIQFEKNDGSTILHNGRNYSICDPTPQLENLLIGQVSSELVTTPYQIVYEYLPFNK